MGSGLWVLTCWLLPAPEEEGGSRQVGRSLRCARRPQMSTPLLLQDQLGLVERYVDGFPGLQWRLLALMDSWCRPGFDISVVAR